MKKIAGVAIVLALSLCVFGCARQTNPTIEDTDYPEPANTENQEKSESKSAKDHSYELTKDLSFQGVSIKADQSWEVKAPKECNYYVHIDDKNGHFSIQTVLHGQTASLEDAWREFFNSDDTPDEIERVTNNGIDYIRGVVRNNHSNYWLLSGNESATGKGFLMTLATSSEEWSAQDQEKVFNDVASTLSFDPSDTTMDYHDWWNANVLNEDTSKQPSGSDEAPKPNTPTVSQQNALKKAKDYLNYTAFSYTGLIEQLEYEKLSTEDATYGADNCGADWNEQAAKKAADYLDYTSFSRDGLIEQLEYEGFTPEQATFGANSVGL